MPIPNVIHFVFGFRPDFNGMPFSFIHYLAVRSASVVNSPHRILFHCRHLPSGYWWDRARPMLTIQEFDPPWQVGGRRISHTAQSADLARLQILHEHGGIYLDMDVICARPFTSLLQRNVVVGEQGVGGEEGVGNAVILAEPGSSFIRRWIEGFDPNTSLWKGFRSTGRDQYFLEYSIWYPRYLSRKFPNEVHVEPHQSFYWPRAQESHFEWFFQQTGSSFDVSYCHHLWESLSWEKYLSKITLEGVLRGDSNFSEIVRRFALDVDK